MQKAFTEEKGIQPSDLVLNTILQYKVSICNDKNTYSFEKLRNERAK